MRRRLALDAEVLDACSTSPRPNSSAHQRLTVTRADERVVGDRRASGPGPAGLPVLRRVADAARRACRARRVRPAAEIAAVEDVVVPRLGSSCMTSVVGVDDLPELRLELGLLLSQCGDLVVLLEAVAVERAAVFGCVRFASGSLHDPRDVRRHGFAAGSPVRADSRSRPIVRPPPKCCTSVKPQRRARCRSRAAARVSNTAQCGTPNCGLMAQAVCRVVVDRAGDVEPALREVGRGA